MAVCNEIESKLQSACRTQSLSSGSPLIGASRSALSILREFWGNDNLYRLFRSQSSQLGQLSHERKLRHRARIQIWPLCLFAGPISGETDIVPLMPAALEGFTFLHLRTETSPPKASTGKSLLPVPVATDPYDSHSQPTTA